jgi:hypothetical protein
MEADGLLIIFTLAALLPAHMPSMLENAFQVRKSIPSTLWLLQAALGVGNGIWSHILYRIVKNNPFKLYTNSKWFLPEFLCGPRGNSGHFPRVSCYP